MVQPTAVVGLVGCGNIFDRYITGLSRFSGVSVVGCADVDQARAAEAAARGGIRAFSSVPQLLADPDVAVIVNITPPSSHASVSSAVLRAGKHVYSEKPLADTTTRAAALLAICAESGCVLGCAPDTFLGSAAQTARRAVDDGAIGEVIGAAAFGTHGRVEQWHPDPGFYFRPGGGPLLDIGPYFITSLVNLLGPVTEVSAITRVGGTPRRVTARDRLVDFVDVEVATHASATLGFESGVIATVLMSFDIWRQDLPFIELYGSTGRLRLPDPDRFDGDVLLRRHDDESWLCLDPVITPSGPLDGAHQGLRGMGVVDLIRSLGGAPQRATAELGYHVLEVLEAIERSSDERSFVQLTSTCERPVPLTTAIT